MSKDKKIVNDQDSIKVTRKIHQDSIKVTRKIHSGL